MKYTKQQIENELYKLNGVSDYLKNLADAFYKIKNDELCLELYRKLNTINIAVDNLEIYINERGGIKCNTQKTIIRTK